MGNKNPGGEKLGLTISLNPILEFPNKLPNIPISIGIAILIISVFIFFKISPSKLYVY